MDDGRWKRWRWRIVQRWHLRPITDQQDDRLLTAERMAPSGGITLFLWWRRLRWWSHRGEKHIFVCDFQRDAYKPRVNQLAREPTAQNRWNRLRKTWFYPKVLSGPIVHIHKLITRHFKSPSLLITSVMRAPKHKNYSLERGSVIKLLFRGDVIKVPPPVSHIKQNGRELSRQLWPNILVRVCRNAGLSAERIWAYYMAGVSGG